MFKKGLCLLTALLFFACQISFAEPEKWTIAMYMVGTDLESEHGLATQDLMEILQASRAKPQTDIYVCTGGATHWSLPMIDANECAVWKIEQGAIHKLTSLGQRNMGDAETLRDFIAVIPPSSQSALVFWDHGAGPVLGFGKDIVSRDVLLLPELAAGLKNGPHWDLIGIDACLSSFELARILKPYADFALFSQEIEPASGWDYTSLVEILCSSSSDDVAEAGTRIADAVVKRWMESYKAYPDLVPPYAVTVADLRKLDNADRSLTDFLQKLCQSVQLGGFPAQSRLLEQIAQPGRYTSPVRYDLVDVVSMAEAYAELYPAESSRLLAALEEMVIACFRTSDRLNGVSMYVPHANQALYASAERLLPQILSPAQIRYAQQFAAAAGAKDDAFDSPVLLHSAGKEIAYQLTPEQAASFAACSVLLYAKTQEDPAYALLGTVGNIVPDEEGGIRYTFENRALWLAASDGSRTVVPLYDLHQDGSIQRARAHAILMAENGLLSNVLLDIAFSREGAQIVGLQPTDGTLGKTALQLNDFSEILFSGGGYIPEEDANGRVLPFSQWSYAPEMTVNILPIDGMMLSFDSYDPQVELFVQFQFRSVYGESHASELIQIQ